MKVAAAVAVLVTIVFALDALAQARQCTTGIPCGNTCISPNDTCHVGVAPDPGTGTSSFDPTPFVVIGSIVGGLLCVGGGIYLWFSDPFHWHSGSIYDDHPAPAGVSNDGVKVFWDCLPHLCGTDLNCREAQAKDLSTAPNKTVWLREHECIPR